ncbi:exodeoxyribonuclease VII large subunit [Pseudomonas sp. 5Ae-yellow]|uniref:exodeoxyribonuclease VII large subunit n=1 Tax=Pseudomonas sp. 5Ae-yellow TaxID=2759848 RepID=UPI000C991808|nr:exodeoxyribonuclease VII large subunit [Pseudomonas sp. 5Ae-yellow]MAB23247.1 exodeoxyribonuclease VII large subunit [Pseudomonadales bacterium]MBA6418232.1 exodeoxyribonuclease VII large subunit [Pseudomonas sp. 5Ae-yellow]|tara:strand:+ start:2331 stop:3707 length:1377 start_codon:yes stop_codon:yes gene_type:complete
MNDDALFKQLGAERDVLSVSQLNARARQLLEDVFPRIWVEGELSNLARPSSGHLYFSLKDDRAQIRCALFRQHASRLKVAMKDGLQVRARGRVSLYEGRGDYQLIVDSIEPAGDGALRKAFEALKAKLQAEGLFEQSLKRPLPAHPQRIGVITSASGAAVRDIISVFQRRAPFIELVIVPSAVQGREAAPQLVRALQQADRAGFDALIVSRGGGSLEDLWPFNEEMVARAIADCQTPTISAVGHETDISISDFVADVRAPTPSAAAELLSPDTQALLRQVEQLERRLLQRLRERLGRARLQLDNLRQRLRHPGERLAQQAQRLDELELRLRRALTQQLTQQQQQLTHLRTRLQTQHPGRHLSQLRDQLEQLEARLPRAMHNQLKQQRQQLEQLAQTLHLVSPLATLGRGYSILLDDNGTAVRSASAASAGQRLKARLHDGELNVRVEAETPYTLSLLD